MKRFRVVYDVRVDDKVPDEHVVFCAREMSMNLRWALVHDTAVYPQALDGPDIHFHGVMPQRADLPWPPLIQQAPVMR